MNFLNKVNQIETKQVVAGQRKKARPGVAFLRLRSYLELGVKAPKDPTHKPARQARLTFELNHPEHMITGTNDKGDYSFPDTLNIYVNIAGPTSRFGKLFSKLNYKGTAVHMAQLVGEGFLGQIHHNGDYVNLSNADGEWTVGAPIHTDVMSNISQDIPIPELDGDKQVFLYDHPDMDDNDIREMWDSIFIEGEWEAKGDKPARSKNWIQEAVMESIDWDTSRTKQAIGDGTATDGAGMASMDADLAALGL